MTSTTFASFGELFRGATGFAGPYAYQQRIADDGFPDVLEAPMGAGKTAAMVLPWLWRRLFHPEADVRRRTPRRLVFALPMRTLVDQLANEAEQWLDHLGLSETVPLHVVMGGRREDTSAWRVNLHRSSLVIGTVDCLVSKALNRGYGLSRGAYPIDFALVTNGAHLVIDEVQLAPASTATLRQLTGFAREFGVAEPFGLTCVSATVDHRVLDTVDNPVRVGLRVESLGDEDRTGLLGRRMAAAKVIRRLPVGADDSAALAQAVAARHVPGSRTLVVVNTVKAAVTLRKALGRLEPEADLVLVHSRFRGTERAEHLDRLLTPPGDAGTIAVTTQVVEAGVDLDARTLITEAAPWPSLCQRTGRCNRYGDHSDAVVWWIPAAGPGPYPEEEIAKAERVLEHLEGVGCSGEDLLAQPVVADDLALRILRRRDFLALFDTTPDLSGADIDISEYIRDTSELDAQLAWVAAPAGAAPPTDFAVPEQAWRCPVPLSGVRQLLKRVDVRAWAFEPTTDRWERAFGNSRLRPGQVILVSADSGGYDPLLGFDPGGKTTVDIGEQEGLDNKRVPAGSGGVDQRADESGNTQAAWLTLDDHLGDAHDQALALWRALGPDLEEGYGRAATAAALLHDIGKSHPAWQGGLAQTAPDPPSDGLLAKSPGAGRMVVEGRPGFRHELVSALMLASPGGEQLRASAPVDDEAEPLVRYLVAAHHGKLRVQVRDAPADVGVSDLLFGVRDGERLPTVQILGVPIPEWTIGLEEFGRGAVAPDSESWSSSALQLLDQLGPFRLAYLETVVRMADWRASAGLPPPTTNEASP